MFKINRWFLGFFLMVVWPSAFMLCAKELSADTISSASEEATPGIDSAVRMAQQEVRDPFTVVQPYETKTSADAFASTAPEIKTELQGIGLGSKGAYAVLGGEVFYKGDEKGGIKLLEVRKREVDILVNGGKVTVLLFPDHDLQKAKDRAKKKGAMESTSVDQPSEISSSLSGREQPPL